MKKVNTANGYDYYAGKMGGKQVYNAVKKGNRKPDTGYFSRDWITQQLGLDPANFKKEKTK